jgi:lytic cellulose monooxygenase (C1-hydroxylating)
VPNNTSFAGYIVTQYPYETNPPDSIGWTESATDLGFVSPDAYAGGDIICHKSATNAKATATVSAGGTVTMEWNTWPSSHKGPVIDYLAPCNGACSTVDKTSLEFFKIDEQGLISDTTSPGTWASDKLISNNNSWVITIPTGIASGPYVLRHEMIALHSAGSTGGAQNYPQCINIEVTGGGSDVPAGTLGEALYKETDPGILVNIYTTGLSYTIPGPALYSGGSGTAVTTKAAASPATSAVASTPTTLATSTITKAPATTSSAAASAGDDTCDA